MTPFHKPTPPQLKKIPKKLTLHGDTRIDNYHWLENKKTPATLNYLKAENAYTEVMMKDTKQLQKLLLKELRSRVEEKDENVPEKIGDYYYYKKFLKGRNYPVFCRKYKSLKAKETIILNCNELAKGHPYFQLSFLHYSPNHRYAAYAVDNNGSEKYTIRIKDLEADKDLPEKIENAEYSFAWSTDNQTFFYNHLNADHKPTKIFRHKLGQTSQKDLCIYEEKDPRFFISCELSRSRQYIFIHAHGNNMSETRYLRADEPEQQFCLLEKRRKDHEYYVDHHGQFFYIVTNQKAPDFKIIKAPIETPSAKNWRTFFPHKKSNLIENIVCLQNHIAVFRRELGITRIYIQDLKKNKFSQIKFPENIYQTSPFANKNFATKTLRLRYSSLITPTSVYDYDLTKKTLILKKQRKIPSGYNAKLYHSERTYAKAPDGQKIPVSLLYKKSLFKKNSQNPLYLTGYGSYGMSSDVYFSSSRLSLVDRGFVYAIAHIRGGQDLGRSWYENGKLLKKKNTFTDFIACTEHLIRQKYAAKTKIVAMGGSAGGLLMGAIANLRPDLFHTIVAHVPFVDCLTTMLNEKLPLTALEYNEWGNPQNPKFYHFIKSYSPYDNVTAKNYPHLLITAGLNDPRVTYWEPAKWTAKLRELKTDQNLLLLKTNLEAGHGGASGRFEYLKEIAFEYAFILKTID